MALGFYWLGADGHVYCLDDASLEARHLEPRVLSLSLDEIIRGEVETAGAECDTRVPHGPDSS